MTERHQPVGTVTGTAILSRHDGACPGENGNGDGISNHDMFGRASEMQQNPLSTCVVQWRRRTRKHQINKHAVRTQARIHAARESHATNSRRTAGDKQQRNSRRTAGVGGVGQAFGHDGAIMRFGEALRVGRHRSTAPAGRAQVCSLASSQWGMLRNESAAAPPVAAGHAAQCRDCNAACAFEGGSGRQVARRPTQRRIRPHRRERKKRRRPRCQNMAAR